ncbi:YhcH/YjgK/YiaL family protein [Dysgonomonas sp. 520]|uniref:YhcH/YjgK/YiaL family protein n=1 Tax=Dysgonomonas sp. 520 TaxID=2302931 RepID=UPI0013D40E5E|nr:YhcH/YjgK/YiaL family protein [Dysgonomonas sp. 520]NDW10751.1 DUF386 domain-containing protein [Dysgonomonas sp. 520]
MIIDNLKNSSVYEGINPLFPKAFEYLKSLDFANLEPGKTVLVENELIVNISDTNLKKVEDAKPEAHDKFIDIQMPVSTAEGFGWACRDLMKEPAGEFDTTKDIIFYKDKTTMNFKLNPGDFAIFFPEDVHAPCIGEGPIRKIVVKILVK